MNEHPSWGRTHQKLGECGLTRIPWMRKMFYLESPKTFFFCVFVFGLIFLRFCSKNAFLEMRTQKKVQSESSSGRVRHGRLKTPFGRKKTRFGRRKKVSGHCLRRIWQGTNKKGTFRDICKKECFLSKTSFSWKGKFKRVIGDSRYIHISLILTHHTSHVSTHRTC